MGHSMDFCYFSKPIPLTSSIEILIFFLSPPKPFQIPYFPTFPSPYPPLYFYSSLLRLIEVIIIFHFLASMSQSIRVLVRIRPLSNSELQRGCKTIINVDEENNQINLTKPEEADNVKSFAYDAVFNEASEQALVYSKSAFSLVEHVLQGYNGTVFAYGQTGCGKTHSMVGQPDNVDLQGIIPRCFGHVLQKISETPHKQFLLRCSFLEIYNQEIHDLLGDPKAKLELKESPQKGVFVKDLTLKQAKTHNQLMEYLNQGTKNRAVGETAMNKDSSRSHLMFALHLESASGDPQNRKYVASKLNLVDLAGSQRLSKTGATGNRMKEGQKINLSLSALGNVISALVEGRSQHIPYRDSKLTRLLQDSLGGNTKTVMLANCSPADYNFQETLSTLRYASRAKLIKNKPIINEDPKDALLKQYANEIERLKSQLQGGPVVADTPELHHKLREKQAELENEKNEKANLLKRIQQLESRHIQSKNVHVDKEIIDNVKRASLLTLQNPKKTTNAQKLSIQLQLQQEEKKANMSFNKTKKDDRQVKDLKQKITQLQKQVRDVDHQNYLEKQCLYEDIRFLTKENKFLESVIGVMIQNHQLEEIRESSVYNEEKDEYRVPPFYFKNKELVFPKLQQQMSMDMIRQKQQGRSLQLQAEKENKESAFKIKDNSSLLLREGKKKKSRDFGVNDILKEAREDIGPNFHLDQKKMPRKIMLNPILKI